LLFAAGIYVSELAEQFFGFHFSVIIVMVIIASILGLVWKKGRPAAVRAPRNLAVP
jgi:hypothetical protein